MEVKTVAVQIHCPYCKEVLYIKEEEFDTETRCSRCQRAFIWSNILEQERWKKENLKRWQESERQKEEMRQLKEVKKSRELHATKYESGTRGAAPIRSRLGLFGALIVIAAAVALAAIIALTLLR
jgi:DNA-directed RNA polymerase subunit M/transcription elongation factor TFIIS